MGETKTEYTEIDNIGEMTIRPFILKLLLSTYHVVVLILNMGMKQKL